MTVDWTAKPVTMAGIQ